MGLRLFRLLGQFAYFFQHSYIYYLALGDLAYSDGSHIFPGPLYIYYTASGCSDYSGYSHIFSSTSILRPLTYFSSTPIYLLLGLGVITGPQAYSGYSHILSSISIFIKGPQAIQTIQAAHIFSPALLYIYYLASCCSGYPGLLTYFPQHFCIFITWPHVVQATQGYSHIFPELLYIYYLAFGYLAYSVYSHIVPALLYIYVYYLAVGDLANSGCS